MQIAISFYIFGLGLASLVVLILSYVLARRLAVVLIGGLLAAGLMAAEAGWLMLMDVEHGTSYPIAFKFAVASVLALAVYFPLAITRHKHLKSRHAESR